MSCPVRPDTGDLSCNRHPGSVLLVALASKIEDIPIGKEQEEGGGDVRVDIFQNLYA